MKAKDYAKQYQQSPGTEGLWKVLKSIIEEIPELIKQRNAKTDAALFSLLDEQERKWKAFINCVGLVEENYAAFDAVIQEYMPLAYVPWKRYKKDIQFTKRLLRK